MEERWFSRSTRAELLYKLSVQGPLPKVTARDGHVQVEYARAAFRMFDFRNHALTLDLSEQIPWELVLRGGVNKLRAQLRRVILSGIETQGGASDVTFELPPPSGTIVIRIAGEASQLRLIRPKHTAARLLVKQGVSGLTIDTMRLGSVGGDTRWESPDYASAEQRYDIEVSGGASDLVITSG